MPPVYIQRNRLVLASLVCSMILVCGGIATADVRLPAVIGERMVLQQQVETPIWGWAEPGESVHVTADWLPAGLSAVAADNGQWQVRLRTPGAGGPHTITVAGHNMITLEDVMIGEVWVCSGQSNMEWPITRALNSEAEIAAADHPNIRLFDVENTFAIEPRADCEGAWVECSPETIRTFSAVGYFFGRELHRELGVPIGLIGTNWGGTLAEAWTSEDPLRAMPDFADALALIARERANPGVLAKEREAGLKRWWAELERLDPGSNADPGWMSAAFDDVAWKSLRVPSAWKGNELEAFDGVVWFRRHVDVPADWEGKDLALELGPIDDIDTTWFNGVRVGGHEKLHQWRAPRRYPVPASAVKSGRNLIAVRVHDIGGQGGLYGKPEQLSLRPVDGERGTAIPLAGEWRYHPGGRLADLPRWPREATFHHNSPTALFNGMIAPLIPFGIRGAIWYQGESNRPRPRQYRALFPRMIGDWRQQWGQGDFPFYYVQIAPFAYPGDTGQAAELREAQLLTLATKNTGMAVTMDIGNPRDIHPRNKQEVGRRLSLWALAKTYGRKGIVHSGPLYKSMKIEGNTIRLFFDHVGGGLASGDEKLTHFSIAGADRVFHPAEAVIDGETVVVSGKEVPNPIAVRYAWGAAAEPNLRNREGLPASSFRTDDWPGVSQPGSFAPRLPSDDYVLVWSDEFSGDALDSSKWSHRHLRPRRDAINVEQAVTLDGEGHLLVTTSRVTKPEGRSESPALFRKKTL